MAAKVKNALVRHYFDSMYALAEHADNAENTFDDGYASSNSENNGGHWYGSASYEQASEFIRAGWNEGAGKLQAALDEATTEGKNAYSAMLPEMTVAGGVPIVGEMLGGNPECMFNPLGYEELPVVTLAVSVGALCNVDPETMIHRGVGILLLAHHLEMTGKTVQILAYSGTRAGDHWMDVMVQVKAPDQPFDLHALAYALINPSMFRRHMFRLIESLPKPHNEEFRYGYGSTLDLTQVEADSTAAEVDWYIPEVKGNPSHFADIPSAVAYIQQQAIEAGILEL